MKRVFVAINLPESVKSALENALEEIRGNYGREVRFLTPENWHLTIVFLAYQNDDKIYRINEAIGETVKDFTPPAIRFEKIVYGPPGKTPRMIWLTAAKETSRALGELKGVLEKNLSQKGVNFRQEQRLFHAHLTLARFEAVGRENLPPLEINFDRRFEGESLDLMESHLKRSGAEYEKLSSLQFGE